MLEYENSISIIDYKMKKQLLLLIVSMFVGSLYAEDVKNERIRPTEEITSPYFSIQLPLQHRNACST